MIACIVGNIQAWKIGQCQSNVGQQDILSHTNYTLCPLGPVPIRILQEGAQDLAARLCKATVE
jgi:hypothetical protein